jgi:hypothetical protein
MHRCRYRVGCDCDCFAKEEPKVHMTATDISEEALATARRNAQNNGAAIEFTAGDMLKPLIEAAGNWMSWSPIRRIFLPRRRWRNRLWTMNRMLLYLAGKMA